MVNKNYCMSSYLAFRYIEADGKEFKEGLHHTNFVPFPNDTKVPCKTADDIDVGIARQFDALKTAGHKLGIMLSGGMDSAILASYTGGGYARLYIQVLGR